MSVAVLSTACQPRQSHRPKVLHKGPFALVPAWLIEAPISDSAFRLAVELLNLGALTRAAWPSNRYLAGRLGLCERKVRYLLRELESAAILVTTPVDGSVNYFRITHPETDVTPARPCPPPRHGRAPNPDIRIQMKDTEKSAGPAPPSARKALSQMRGMESPNTEPKDHRDRRAINQATVLITKIELWPGIKRGEIGKWWGMSIKRRRHYGPMLEALAQLATHLSTTQKAPTRVLGYLERTYKEKEANHFGSRAEAENADFKNGPTIFDAVFGPANQRKTTT